VRGGDLGGVPVKMFPLGGCATCGVNEEVRPGCRLCRDCLVIADVIYEAVRREEHRARGGSDANYFIVDPEARWPIDENGGGPFGWRGDPRAAVGVTCNVCRNQPEARAGLRMCRSCLRLAADLWSSLFAHLPFPVSATQNPLPAEAPQVPENTPAAEAPADPTQNDPIASGPSCLWCRSEELRRCLKEVLEHDARGYWKNGHFTNGMRRRLEAAITRPIALDRADCVSPTHVPPDPSPVSPEVRATAMGAELGQAIGQTAVAAAEAAEQAPAAAAETWGICEINRKPHVLWRDHKCVGWVS
jgi:hypothetical protein